VVNVDLLERRDDAEAVAADLHDIAGPDFDLSDAVVESLLLCLQCCLYSRLSFY
jgi:hypothetical protein